MLDKNRLADILVPIMEEGYELISKMKLTDKDFASTVVNMVNTERTITDLRDQAKFEEGQDLLKDKQSEDITESEVSE